jgi:arylamine N-acetyltransferase
LTRATAILLDLHGTELRRAADGSSPGTGLLGDISSAFSTIPWENLSKFLRRNSFGRRPADLLAQLPDSSVSSPGPFYSSVDGATGELLRFADDLLEEHQSCGTGGTCFSLTNALGLVLSDLGYDVVPVMGDMKHGSNIHCGLLVRTVQGVFMLDPGYLVAEPVPVLPGRSVELRNGPVRLVYGFDQDGAEATLSTASGEDTLQVRYRMRLRAVGSGEFLGHWLDSFDSVGMRSLHLNTISGGDRLSAHNLNLRLDHGSSRENLKFRESYASVIENRFGISGRIAEEAHRLWRESREDRAGKGAIPG